MNTSERHPSFRWRNRPSERDRGSGPLHAEEFDALMRHDRYPRAARYDPAWIATSHMGPHPLWLSEELANRLDLRAGMRVLDMGCGTAMTSIFLALECGVEVWATDLWVPAHDNLARIAEAGLIDRVYPVHAEGRAYPFQQSFFDVAVSIDSYHYWGQAPGHIDYVASFVKPGGQIGIIVPSDASSIAASDSGVFPNSAWWDQLWRQSQCVNVEAADAIDDGWSLWWRWVEAGMAWRGTTDPSTEPDADLLQGNASLGFATATARVVSDV